MQEALNKQNLNCKVIELSSSTRTASDAATSIGCHIARIVKSLVFKTQLTNRPVLVLASGYNQVNEKAIEFYVGEIIVRATANFVRDITRFAIGGVPPVGHKERIEFIFIDQVLLEFESVWAAAGTPNSVFNISGKNLLEITQGEIISIR